MEDSPFLMFINPVSGGGLGTQLIESVREYSNITIVELPAGASTWTTLSEDLLRNTSLKIIVAGGDGTVNWVITMLGDYYGRDNSSTRPPIAIIPLGTGNDMSRMMKWGGSFSDSDVKHIDKLLEKINNSNKIVEVDVWTVQSQRTDIQEEPKIRTMLNYFSIGVDAKLCVDFETCRKTHPGCFCCHCAAYMMYLPLGCKSLCCIPKLHEELEYVKLKNRDGSEGNLDINNSRKTLIFQAITSIYGGSDFWGEDPNRAMNDGLFEVMEQGGVVMCGLSKIGIPCYTRMQQAGRAEIKTKDPVFYQIDGEGIISNGETKFVIEKIGTWPMLEKVSKKK